MKVDVEGNVYCGGAGGIWVMDKTGKKLGRIVHGATGDDQHRLWRRRLEDAVFHQPQPSRHDQGENRRHSGAGEVARVKLYLASPLGFSEAGRAFHDGVLVPLLRGLGHEVLDPWRLTDTAKIEAVAAMPYGVEKRDAWRRLNAEIGRNNKDAIDHADAVLAVLDGVRRG